MNLGQVVCLTLHPFSHLSRCVLKVCVPRSVPFKTLYLSADSEWH